MERFALPSMYELCLVHTRADRVLRSLVVTKLESQQLTLMEWLALSAVVAGPKAGMSMSEIAKTLDVTLPQVTALAADLLESKFIKQKVLTTDHRARQITSTLKGKRVVGKLETAIAKDLTRLTKSVPRNRLQEYMRVLQQISDQSE